MTVYSCSLCGGYHNSTEPPCVITYKIETVSDWTVELRRRCLEAGYGNVFIGQCDVEGVDKNGKSFCTQKPHGKGPMIDDKPAIWVILKELGLPMASGSCHWASFFTNEMTKEQKKVVTNLPYWVRERAGR